MKYVTAFEMQEIDRRAIQEFGIPSILLMENAGRSVADEICKIVNAKTGSVSSERGSPAPASANHIAIFCGKGNNGGDGFVAARHLINRGFQVNVFFFQNSSEMKPDPLINFKILQKMTARAAQAALLLIDCTNTFNLAEMKQAIDRSSVVVDALFGIGLSKPIDNPFKTVIQLINQSETNVVSVDIPSGLHADTGEVMGVCIQADTTVTLALPKKGFLLNRAGRYTGKIIVADISIPNKLLI